MHSFTTLSRWMWLCEMKWNQQKLKEMKERACTMLYKRIANIAKIKSFISFRVILTNQQKKQIKIGHCFKHANWELILNFGLELISFHITWKIIFLLYTQEMFIKNGAIPFPFNVYYYLEIRILNFLTNPYIGTLIWSVTLLIS